MLRYLTAGESHGKGLLGILDGIPSGLTLKDEYINKELKRRQAGFGRGKRMEIEKDEVEIIAGITSGITIGSPIGLLIRNRDWDNWKDAIPTPITRPRPGHADLSGAIKYGHRDIRDVLERASARETAMRVAIGAVCKRFLEEFGIKVVSWVVEIGGVKISSKFKVQSSKLEDLFLRAEASDVRCPDKGTEAQMKKKIVQAKEKGDSVGGIFEVIVTGIPPGLGSYSQWNKRLNGRLAQAIISIQAIKGVEIGLGFESARRPGSKVHDEIFYRSQESEVRGQKKNLSSVFWPLPSGFYRKTNNAGGIEGGVTNGEDIVIRAAMKPVATLYKPLQSVDIITKEPIKAGIERADICAVPAASVIAEAVVAFEIADAMFGKFGGDSLNETKRNYTAYLEYVRNF